MPKKRTTRNSKASQPAARSKGPSGKAASPARRRVLFALGAVAVAGGGGFLLLKPTPSMAEEVVVYKDPSCECCGRWARHMRRNGFAVTVHNVEDMGPVKSEAGIPEAMESCHTAFVGGYSVEGHVPASDVKRMLAERPAIKGLAVPGMPMSAPGMDSPEGEPYTVLAFDAEGGTRIFASY
jgi:hypothetical protein